MQNHILRHRDIMCFLLCQVEEIEQVILLPRSISRRRLFLDVLLVVRKCDGMDS